MPGDLAVERQYRKLKPITVLLDPMPIWRAAAAAS